MTSPNGDGETVENQPQPGETELAEKWVVTAWKLWLNGLRNWSAIGRQVQKDRETVKKYVIKYGETLAAMYVSRKPNSLAEYVDGCVEDLAFFMRQAVRAELGEAPTPDDPRHVQPDIRAAIAARREVSARRRDIAEALGVIGGIQSPIVQANFLVGAGEDNGLTPQMLRFMLQREGHIIEGRPPALIEGTPPDESPAD